MIMKPTLVTAPTSWGVSLDEAVEHCRYEIGDDTNNLSRLIRAAHGFVQERTGLLIGAQTWSWSFRATGSADVRLPKAPVTALTAVSYVDADGSVQAGTLDHYLVFRHADRPFLRPLSGWPVTYDRPDAITVTFTAGLTAVPETIRHAMLMLVEHWDNNRSAVVDGQSRDVPMAVNALLDVEQRIWIEA